MPIFHRLSVRGKLLAGFSITILIGSLLGVYAKLTLDATNRSFLTLNQNYKELRGFLSLEISNKRLTDDVKSFLLTKDPKWETDYNQTLAQLDNSISELQATNLTPDEVATLHTFEQITGKLKGTELLILATAKEGNVVKAIQLFDSKYDQSEESISDLVSSLVKSKSSEVEQTVEISRQLLDQTQNGALGLLLLAFVCSLGFAVYFANYLTKAIRSLTAVAGKLAAGDLTARSQVSTKDEIEALGVSFNVMAENLDQNIRKLKLTEEQIAAERNKLLLVLSGIRDAVIAVDLNREIVIFNRAAEQLTGKSFNDVHHQPIEQVVKIFSGQKELGPREYCPVRTDNFEGVTFSQENLTLENKAGQRMTITLTAGQIKEGASVNLGCILTLSS